MRIHIHICMNVCTRIYLCFDTYKHIHSHMYLQTWICVCTRTSTYVFLAQLLAPALNVFVLRSSCLVYLRLFWDNTCIRKNDASYVTWLMRVARFFYTCGMIHSCDMIDTFVLKPPQWPLSHVTRVMLCNMSHRRRFPRIDSYSCYAKIRASLVAWRFESNLIIVMYKSVTAHMNDSWHP